MPEIQLRFSNQLYPKQQAAIFDPHRISLIEASTKSGKTYGCIRWLFVNAMTHPKSICLWVAPILAQAKEYAFDPMFKAIEEHPDFAKLVKVHLSPLKIELPNGSVIYFKGADNPNSLWGAGVNYVVVDEFSRAKGEAVWAAIESITTKTAGEIRVIGNVTNRNNKFWELCRLAEKGRFPNAAYHKLTCWDAVEAGVLKRSIVDEKKARAEAAGTPEIFLRDYMAELVDSRLNPFGWKSIDACVADMSDKPPVAFGLDIGQSIDWTVLHALDEDRVSCYFKRWQPTYNTEFFDFLAETIGDVPCLVDCTGVGKPILDMLQERLGSISGFRFSAPSKQELIGSLIVAIQEQSIRYPEGVIADELRDFEYEETRTGPRYGAPSGTHDDCVIALALANAQWLDQPQDLKVWILGEEEDKPWWADFVEDTDE